MMLCMVFLSLALGSSASCEEGWEIGRLRITPKLALLADYSDNIYLVEDEEEDDIYIIVSPEISFDVAVAPRNYFSLKYSGFFLNFDTAENFDENHHIGELSWHTETAKGSTLTAGASIDDNSIQPFSVDEVAKKYQLYRGFADVLLMAGSMIEIGAGYERLSRRFDEDRFESDDYDRNRYDISLLYKKSEKFPLLLEYRFVQQDNQDLDRAFDTDYDTHTIFIGSRWRPTAKLSGALRVGYIRSDFEDDSIDDFDGVAADIDITYSITEITKFELVVARDVEPVTRTLRETGSYYVLSSAGIVLTHQKWERIITELSYLYRHKAFEGGPLDRTDRYHDAGLKLRYLLKDWVSFSIGYNYRSNSSDLTTVEYTENMAEAGILFEF